MLISNKQQFPIKNYLISFLQRLQFEFDGDSGPGSDDGRSDLGVHVISDSAPDGIQKENQESRVVSTKKKSFIVSCVAEPSLQESKITEDESEEQIVTSDNYISPENTQTSLPSSSATTTQTNVALDSEASSNYDTEKSLKGKKVPVDLNDLQEKLTQLTQKQSVAGGSNASLNPQDGVPSQTGTSSLPTPCAENQPASMQDIQQTSGAPYSTNQQDASQKLFPSKDGQSFSRNTQPVLHQSNEGSATPNQLPTMSSQHSLSQPLDPLQIPLNQSFSGSVSNLSQQGQSNQQMYFQQPAPQYQMMFPPYQADPMFMSMIGYQQMMYASMMMHQQQAQHQQQQQSQQTQQQSQFLPPHVMYPNWMMQGQQMPYYPQIGGGTQNIPSQFPQNLQNLQSDVTSLISSHPTSPSVMRKGETETQGESSSAHSSVSGSHGAGKKELSIKQLEEELNKLHVANIQKSDSKDGVVVTVNSDTKIAEDAKNTDSVPMEQSGANSSVDTDLQITDKTKFKSRFAVSVVKEDKLPEQFLKDSESSVDKEIPLASEELDGNDIHKNIVKQTLEEILDKVTEITGDDMEKEMKDEDVGRLEQAEQTGRRRSRFQVTKIEENIETATDSLSPSPPAPEGGGPSSSNIASSKSVSHSLVSSIVSNNPVSPNQHRKASIAVPFSFIRARKLDISKRRRVKSCGSFEDDVESCPDCRRGSLMLGTGMDNDSENHKKHLSSQHTESYDKNISTDLPIGSPTSPAFFYLDPTVNQEVKWVGYASF